MADCSTPRCAWSASCWLRLSADLAELNAYSLLNNVTLEYSSEKDFAGQKMREFKINMALASGADVRQVDPLIKPRNMRNPLDDGVQYAPIPGAQTASVPN